MGKVDRIIRLVIAGIIVALYFSNVISGTVALVLLVFAAIFTATSLFSTCPLYLPFGIRTNGIRKKK